MPARRKKSVALTIGLIGLAGAAQPRTSPEWLRSAVIYEINPRTFSSSGDFRGIAARLPELRDLGVTILWLMPIHPSGQERSKGSLGSPYAVRDYYGINPAYGTPDSFHSLIRQAHDLGFKIIIDVVADHTSWDSVLMDKPAFYKHGPNGAIIPPAPDWSDVAALNFDNPEVSEYMIRMLEYWIRDFDLDGFRCDVAGMVPTRFWDAARAALDRIKPGVILLAEWHSPDLLERAFDLDYSWPLHKALTQVFEHGGDAAAIEWEWREERRIYRADALHLRFSDNHDEMRAIARFGERGALAASALMFTLDGVPLLYNGMEAGDTTESGAPALFERLPVFWGIAERRPQFPRFYRQMIRLRRENPPLQQGETVWLKNSDSRRILSFVRQDSQSRFLVLVNCSNQPFEGTVDGVATDGWEDVTPDARLESSPPAPRFKPPDVRLEAWGFRILREARAPAPR